MIVAAVAVGAFIALISLAFVVVRVRNKRSRQEMRQRFEDLKNNGAFY